MNRYLAIDTVPPLTYPVVLIHGTSFEVISVGGQQKPAGSEVLIRMKYRQWTGKSVFHCHILPHEDTGMMQNFLIVG